MLPGCPSWSQWEPCQVNADATAKWNISFKTIDEMWPFPYMNFIIEIFPKFYLTNIQNILLFGFPVFLFINIFLILTPKAKEKKGKKWPSEMKDLFVLAQVTKVNLRFKCENWKKNNFQTQNTNFSSFLVEYSKHFGTISVFPHINNDLSTTTTVQCSCLSSTMLPQDEDTKLLTLKSAWKCFQKMLQGHLTSSEVWKKIPKKN